MHKVEGALLLSPSDLVGHLACEHLTQLELAVQRGERVRPERHDPELDLLAEKGAAHERVQLGVLESRHGLSVTIADHRETLDGLRAAEAETLAAMRAGAPLIYQAAFFDGRWRGRADFLIRVDTPSELGPWSYEVADAKLARSVKVAALLQMCDYSRHVARLQGSVPENIHVILGTGERETHRVGDYDAYYRLSRARFEAAVDAPCAGAYPEPVSHCTTCRWRDVCDATRVTDDHLSLVAGMRRDQTRRLVAVGISTVAELAAAPPECEAKIGDAAWLRLRHQAALQIRERTTNTPHYELVEVDHADLGLAALPEPSSGDLYFDIEGDPYVEDGGLEYLFGVTEIVDGEAIYRAFWAHSHEEEKRAFAEVVDLVTERFEADPSLHVYHYAPYEPNTLKKLMGRHQSREDEVDRLLRAGVFVDLYQVVRQGVRVSRSYGLKKLEAFYMAERTEEIAEGAASIIAYERWRETNSRQELDELAAYNARDCESTWRLRNWLEERRTEWQSLHGRSLPRPRPRTGEPSEELVRAAAETRELVAQLTSGVPVDEASRTAEDSARILLSKLVDWHRREDKSSWWAFFDRQRRTDVELVDDPDAIGDIVHAGELRSEKLGAVHRYDFDPTQEHKIGAGDDVYDPRTARKCGEVRAIDGEAGVLELYRTGPPGEAHPRSLIPRPPIDTKGQRASLQRLARWVVDNGVDAPGAYRAARDLLLGARPRVGGLASGSLLARAGEDGVDTARRLVAALESSALAVQGPPGSGKTYTGAQTVVDVVGRGLRVAVCATSHRAIGELLTAVSDALQARRVSARVLHRSNKEDDDCTAAGVEPVRDNGKVDAALDGEGPLVVGGTPWLFCRGEVEGRFDLLIIDEAAQMSLANALAVAGAARNLVLLGDPQQLAQPSRGVQPPGADVSALAHILAGHETVPGDRGVFLATTRRMHPEICAFISAAFYDGRLASYPDTARQRLDAGAGGDAGAHLTGAGLRLVRIDHDGNRTDAPEEVDAVRRVTDGLLGLSWTDRWGTSHPVGVDDILVVAPYNVQVRRLRDGLRDGARVGTVDKFQGQEAAVTVYSMTTSSAEDMPRNLEFLFSRNRLNVAVSRAQAMAVVVCSPRLFFAGCRTPAQLRLVSALCRYVEMAADIDAPAASLASAAGGS